jgi:hypothetical protein
MQVEVTEQNIVLYGLVQLTGNTAEELMRLAKEAEEKGFALTCRIPDIDDVLEMNVFDSDTVTEAPEGIEHTHPNSGIAEHARVIDSIGEVLYVSLDKEGLFGPVEIVQGEVVDNKEENDG